jgi:hypothetical protein
MALNTYETDKVLLVIAGIPVTGFGKDTFIEIEREEDSFTTYVGSLGDVCRTKNLNKTGKLTITLMMDAPSNNLLAAQAQIDEEFATGVGPFMLKDMSGTMFASGAECWVMKRPKIERAKESGTIQWVFMVAELFVFEGGTV